MMQAAVRRAWTLPVGLALCALTACQTTSGGSRSDLPAPVMPDVLPQQAPGNLARPDSIEGPVMVQHTDGNLYVQGLGEGVEPGTGMLLRYGGEWFEKGGERPTVGFVRATKVYGGGVALVEPEYLLPEADYKNTMVQIWTETTPPSIGKGLGAISALGEKVEVSLDNASGVQVGDKYAILAPPKGGQRLGERLTGFVQIESVDRKGGVASLVKASGTAGDAKVGHWVVFMGAGLVDPPLEGVIQVSKIEGADDAQGQVVAALNAYLKSIDAVSMKAEPLDAQVDPMDLSFGRDVAGLEFVEKPRMLLAGAVVDKGGKKHIVFNYTNTGLSVAHSMIAATPEVGLDAGPVGGLDADSLAPVFHNTVASALTHRGQNDEAIHLLETKLAQGGWDGPNRWHARDQLAMRWSQASRNWEALRTVHQDVARAEATKDPAGVINAVGTLMPLYEEIGDMELSLVEAERFYTLRKAAGDDPFAKHAWRAFIEVLFKAGKTEDAERELTNLIAACNPAIDAARAAAASGEEADQDKTACVVDVYSSLMTFYWYSSRQDPKRSGYFAKAIELAELVPGGSMGSIRLAQAMDAMFNRDFDGAMIGFLEARRIYEADGHTPGIARIDRLAFQLFLARGERDRAFEVAMKAADAFARMRDVTELIGTYRVVTQLYANVPPGDMRMSAYARSAYNTMSDALRLQFAGDDLGSAAEVLFVSGRFRVSANPEEAQKLIERASELSVRATRFDLAALSRLALAMLSKAQGNGAAFRANIEMAKELARITGDADLLQNIIQVEQGDFQPPTTL